MLQLDSVSVDYGGLHALRDVSLKVERGQFVAVVGPNGAGKTTLFKTISGTAQPSHGRILFEDQDLLAYPAAKRPHLGIAHVPEGRKVFGSMTVLENLEMGATTKAGQASWKHNLERIFSIFPRLAERREQLAGTLSGGEQQMVAIARGMASSPRLLMLDEPSMGLSPSMGDVIFDGIRQLHRDHSLTILLVEQRVAEALERSDHGYVLETGHIVLEGPYETLLSDDRVRRSYLGLTEA
jgi:branched-chain amino acid transport system ATP-binding protein